MESMSAATRKRVGRPPKVTKTAQRKGVQMQDSIESNQEINDMYEQDTSSAIATDDHSNYTLETGGSMVVECRRSSRKKSIKFDVREVLNKNRKPHKIQIEARIDSNTPCVSRNAMHVVTMMSGNNITIGNAKGKLNPTDRTVKQNNSFDDSEVFRTYSVPDQELHIIDDNHDRVIGALICADSNDDGQQFCREQSIFNMLSDNTGELSGSAVIISDLDSAGPSSAESEIPTATQKGISSRRKVLGKCAKAITPVISPRLSEKVAALQQPKRRGRPPKNKSNLDESELQHSFIENAAVTHSAPVASEKCINESNTNLNVMIEGDTVPDYCMSQENIIVEISSSSSMHSGSYHHADLSHINLDDSKSRNFAAVSFLQESLSMDNDNVSQPDFIVAAVEEITSETQAAQKADAADDEAIFNDLIEIEHEGSFEIERSLTNDETGTGVIPFEEVNEKPQVVECSQDEEGSVMELENLSHTESREFERCLRSSASNSPATILQTPREMQNPKPRTYSRRGKRLTAKQRNSPSTVGRVTRNMVAEADDSVTITHEHEVPNATSTSLALEPSQSRSSGTPTLQSSNFVDDDLESVIEKSVIVNTYVQRDSPTTDVRQQGALVLESENNQPLVLPLKKQVKNYTFFNAMPEQESASSTEAQIQAISNATETEIAESYPKQLFESEHVHGTLSGQQSECAQVSIEDSNEQSASQSEQQPQQQQLIGEQQAIIEESYTLIEEHGVDEVQEVYHVDVPDMGQGANDDISDSHDQPTDQERGETGKQQDTIMEHCGAHQASVDEEKKEDLVDCEESPAYEAVTVTTEKAIFVCEKSSPPETGESNSGFSSELQNESRAEESPKERSSGVEKDSSEEASISPKQETVETSHIECFVVNEEKVRDDLCQLLHSEEVTNSHNKKEDNTTEVIVQEELSTAQESKATKQIDDNDSTKSDATVAHSSIVDAEQSVQISTASMPGPSKSSPLRRGRKTKKKVKELNKPQTKVVNDEEVITVEMKIEKNDGTEKPTSASGVYESERCGDQLQGSNAGEQIERSEEMALKAKESLTHASADSKEPKQSSPLLEETSYNETEYTWSTKEQIKLIGNIHHYVDKEESLESKEEDDVNLTAKAERVKSRGACATDRALEAESVSRRDTKLISRRRKTIAEAEGVVRSRENETKKKRQRKLKQTSAKGTIKDDEQLQPKESIKSEPTSKETIEPNNEVMILDELASADVKNEKVQKADKGIKEVVESQTQALEIDVSSIPLPEAAPKPLPKGLITPTEEESSDPLQDIEKFIEYGVNLLKRDYKADNEAGGADGVKDGKVASGEGQSQVKEEPTQQATEDKKVEADKNVANLEVPDGDLKQEQTVASAENIVNTYFETPTDTPVGTPAACSPRKSPVYDESFLFEEEEFTGVRRSHRIKKIHNAPRALVGRGVVETKPKYNFEEHLFDLAEVEARNTEFLKEMEERLSNFQVIKENEYRCERVVSKEARKMLCDCFLTTDEEERGEMGCGEDCLNRLLMIECGPNCNVKERCTNRRFQKFLYSPCRIFRTERKGFGIMSESGVLPGEFIMEYVGEVINGEEFERRRNLYSKDKNRHYYFMALRSDTIIDATVKGNISRFINHSCDPNAETQKWTVNGELRIGFFSRKAILPGEEITFDYQYQRYGREAQRCYCESANCRGWIGEEPNSDEGEQHEDDSEDDEKMSRGEGEDDSDDDDPEVAQRKRQLDAMRAELSDDEGEDVRKDDDGKGGLAEESNAMFKRLLAKIAVKLEEKQKQNKVEKRRRRRRGRGRHSPNEFSPSKSRYLEDPDIDVDIAVFDEYGLKNQSDTLRLSRIMVRAKLASTRLRLLKLLRNGELPCRRLFLDYHGLRLLHGWMSEDIQNVDMRMPYLETLESLPVTNKTMLTDSKVYDIVRSWCGSNMETTGVVSPSVSDESSKESSENSAQKEVDKDEKKKEDEEKEKEKDKEKEAAVATTTEANKLAVNLLSAWDSLPESYRIPKRERIEQMKEHEREADRQYEAGLDDDEDSTSITVEGYQRDRFGRDSTRVYQKRTKDERTITVMGGSIMTDPRKYLSKEQRRELFEAQVAHDERIAFERRAFAEHCFYFGLDPENTRAQDMPYMMNQQTGEWWSVSDELIETPPKFVDKPMPMKAMSTDPTDYELPPEVDELADNWRYAITAQGHIYYYHVEKRIPQWEPPTPEQIAQADEVGYDSDINEEEYSTEDEDDIIAEMDDEKLKEYIEKRIKQRKEHRQSNLVEERPISPRKEEDRIYNQIEMRKYKENKEKIRKRKEEIRRRRMDAIKRAAKNPELRTVETVTTVSNNEEDGDKSKTDSEPTNQPVAVAVAVANAESTSVQTIEPVDAIPIQDYLLSSDEDDYGGDGKENALLDKIVEGDKIVDELDALTTKRPLKRALPGSHRESAIINTSTTGDAGSVESGVQNPDKERERDRDRDREREHAKKRKTEKREKREKRSSKETDSKQRKLKDKFRYEIAGIIMQHLKPYRKDSCQTGRILTDDDFNHLTRKLTHFVMLKEMKYCASVGQTLVVNDSVKNKSREFIRKYMAKYDGIYIRPAADPDFKDIPKITC